MLRKRIKKNTLKWKKIYAEQLLDMMDEEENALQKIYLTGYVLELKKNRYFAGWYKDRIVCRSLEYARYFPSAEAAEEYVHKYLGFAGMICYVCHVNWTLASCESENMEDNEENLLEENGKILSFANYADVKQYQKQRGMEHSTMAITYANADAVFFAVVNHDSADPGIIAGKVFVKMPEILWLCHPQKAIKFQ